MEPDWAALQRDALRDADHAEVRDLRYRVEKLEDVAKDRKAFWGGVRRALLGLVLVGLGVGVGMLFRHG